MDRDDRLMIDRQIIYDSFGEAAFGLIDNAFAEMPSQAAEAIKKLLLAGDASLEIKLVLPHYHIQCDLVQGDDRTNLFTVEAEPMITH